MNAFSIDNEAALQIQRIISSSNYLDPVVELYESSDDDGLFDDLKQVFIGKDRTSNRFEQACQEQFRALSSEIRSMLMIRLHERVNFQTRDLFEIHEGIVFVLAPEAAVMLSDYQLIFENGRFLLRDTDKVAHTLRSIAELRYGHT